MSLLTNRQENNLKRALVEVRQLTLRPPPQLTLSQWCEEYLYLSPESSALPGRFRFDRAEFQREVFDELSAPDNNKVVIMAASQILKTQALLALVGYIIHLDPGPILSVQPTLKMANTFSKDRIDTMIRDTKALKGKVADKRVRDGGNTTMHKTFPGGALTIATANSPADLAARPIRYLLFDETDRYGTTDEGNPIDIAEKRVSTFWNSKIVHVSSPGDEETSSINKEFLLSDQRYYIVPCPDCGHEQQLIWSQVKWEKDHPETTHYECSACKSQWNDQQKNDAVAKGHWEATNPHGRFPGFNLSALYSSFRTLRSLVEEFIDAKDDPESLKVFINTRLASVWKSDIKTMDDLEFLSRLEHYTPEKLPEQILLITAGVDVQVDRLEMEVVGWGKGDESWSIEYVTIQGNPTSPAPWLQLEQYLTKKYTRTDGLELNINAFCIDVGGTATNDVFAFANKHMKRNVYPIKGIGGPGKPLFPRKFKRWAKTGWRFYGLGVDTGKERIYNFLRIDTPGPGYCHFPDGYTEEYFDGLTCERYEVVKKKGQNIKQWFNPPGKRNEPFDCRNYAMAARYSFNINMDRREDALKAKLTKKSEAEVKQAELLAEKELMEQKVINRIEPKTRHPRRTGGYVSGMIR